MRRAPFLDDMATPGNSSSARLTTERVRLCSVIAIFTGPVNMAYLQHCEGPVDIVRGRPRSPVCHFAIRNRDSGERAGPLPHGASCGTTSATSASTASSISQKPRRRSKMSPADACATTCARLGTSPSASSTTDSHQGRPSLREDVHDPDVALIEPPGAVKKCPVVRESVGAHLARPTRQVGHPSLPSCLDRIAPDAVLVGTEIVDVAAVRGEARDSGFEPPALVPVPVDGPSPSPAIRGVLVEYPAAVGRPIIGPVTVLDERRGLSAFGVYHPRLGWLRSEEHTSELQSRLH